VAINWGLRMEVVALGYGRTSNVKKAQGLKLNNVLSIIKSIY